MLSQGKTPSRCRILLCEWQESIPPFSQPRLAVFFSNNQQSSCSVKLFLIFAPLAQVQAFHAATCCFHFATLFCFVLQHPFLVKKLSYSTRCWPQNYVAPIRSHATSHTAMTNTVIGLRCSTASGIARPITAEADCPLCGTRTVRGLILSPASQFVSSAILPSQPGLCPALCRGPRRNAVSSLMYFEDQLKLVQVSNAWQCYMMCSSRNYKTYSKRK
jgi:hypothetical protein